jgi:hypothetical protein
MSENNGFVFRWDGNTANSVAEIDRQWRESKTDSHEGQHIRRLFTEPYDEQNPTTRELFAEGAKVTCFCGHRMETWREFQDHTESSRDYYRNMRRMPQEIPEQTRSIAMWNAAMDAIKESPDHDKIFDRIWEILPARMEVASDVKEPTNDSTELKAEKKK